MACELSLYLDNSVYFRVVLTNPDLDPIYVNDATVEATLYDDQDTEVTGQVWPIILAYEVASDGIYEETIAPLAALVENAQYTVKYVATGSDGTIGQWTNSVVAKVRKCT